MSSSSLALTLSRPEAAALCGLTTAGFDVWVRKGIVPPAIDGTRRWSRVQLERALAGMSFVAIDAAVEPESPFLKWQRENSSSAGDSKQEDRPPTRLGKREVAVLKQLYERRGKKTRDSDLSGGGISTITKLGERGYLRPQGNNYYHLELTPAGIAACEALQ